MKIILTLLSVLCFTAVRAQLLNTTEITPHLEEQYHIYLVSNAAEIEVGNAGINQSWYLGNVQFDTNTSVIKQVVPTSSTPHGSLYPGASIAVQSFYTDAPNDLTYLYYTDTGTTFCFLGSKGLLTQVYSDPILEFNFPFGYNNHILDNYCFTSTGLSATYNFCGQSDMHFDGVGDLILPFGMYTGIYRMKYTRKSWDISSPLDTTTIVTYYWYKPDIHHPLAVYEEITGSNGATLVSANILSLSTINAISETVTTPLRVYPNPFEDNLVVETGLLHDHGNVTIYDISGKPVYNALVDDGAINIALEKLAAGPYILVVRNGDVDRRRLILKSK
jgi:hypothetical protein